MTQALLDLRGLVKRYGGLVATDHLDLAVQAGHTHAIIGPDGAGKTTLIHQIAGGLQPNEGRIFFDGEDITALPMHRRVQRGLARSYQITNIFKSCSVLDNLALAVQARSGTSMRFWRPAIGDSAVFDEARELAATIGLEPHVGTLARNLAHGQQRQLEVGLALATRPRMLLLDEPMAGMGPGESLQLVELITRLRGSTTILLIEHDMEAVFQLAERISVLVFGRIIASGDAEEIRRNPEVKKAYLGDEAAA
jgi:branched-chain amino acid transport system ATP-binding protein